MTERTGARHPVVSHPQESRFLRFSPEVRLVDGDSPALTFPRGFLAAGISAGLKESGRPDLGILTVAPQWWEDACSAGVFTTNAFAAAPVVVDREECDLERLVAVVMNSGNANACTGEQGLATARAMQQAAARAVGAPVQRVAVSSTGIIGVQLDAEVVVRGIHKAAAALRPDGGADFARSILTTDRFPKSCALEVSTPAGQVRLGACAKGAGMISPAMATMLCAVTTDARLTAEQAKALLRFTVDRTFNRISVDGEMSTNDSVLFLASGASGVGLSPADLSLFASALEALLLRVALMIVADGEGATKVIRIEVLGAENEGQAMKVARAVAGSPLVKTAMHGEDPNWGRIVSAAGAALAGRELPRASLRLAGVTVFSGGAAHRVSEVERSALVAAMREPEIEAVLDLGLGEATGCVYFSDLGHDYITINAEYHT